jgi:hypothetical protein
VLSTMSLVNDTVKKNSCCCRAAAALFAEETELKRMDVAHFCKSPNEKMETAKEKDKTIPLKKEQANDV